MAPNQRPIIFTHIPRTAGTSLRSLLYQAALKAGAPPARIHVPGFGGVGDEENSVYLDQEGIENLKSRRPLLIADHGIWGIHQRLRLENPFYFVMFRDPLKALCSNLYSAMTDAVVKKSPLTINEFAKLFDADQIGYLTRLTEAPPINDWPADILKILAADFDNFYLEFLDLPKTAAGIAQVEKRLIDDYGAIGITEKFDQSIRLLAQLAPGWLRLSDSGPRLNAGGRETELSTTASEILAPHFELNLQVYDLARRIFENRLARAEKK